MIICYCLRKIYKLCGVTSPSIFLLRTRRVYAIYNLSFLFLNESIDRTQIKNDKLKLVGQAA